MRGARRRVLVVASMAVVAVALTGCGTQKAGTAATAGDERLTESELVAQLDELDALYSANTDVARIPDDALVASSVSWWLNWQVAQQVAEDLDITVTDAQIDAVLGAPDQDLDQISMAAGIAPSLLEGAAEAAVVQSVLFQQGTADGTSEEEVAVQVNETFQKAADEMGISVNPRFGSGWAPDFQGQLLPRDPERLSSPAAAPTTAPTSPTDQ